MVAYLSPALDPPRDGVIAVPFAVVVRKLQEPRVQAAWGLVCTHLAPLHDGLECRKCRLSETQLSVANIPHFTPAEQGMQGGALLLEDSRRRPSRAGTGPSARLGRREPLP